MPAQARIFILKSPLSVSTSPMGRLMALCYVAMKLESMPPKAADAILGAETTCRPCIAAEGHSIAISRLEVLQDYH